MKNKWKKDHTCPCIYRISCRDPEVKDCYIGCTTNLNERMKLHLYCVENPYVKGLYQYVHQFIRANGVWNNWIIHVMEWCPECETFEELEDKEKWYILRDPNTRRLNIKREEPEKDTYVAKNVEDYEEYYYPDTQGQMRMKYEKALRLDKVMFI